MHKTEKIFVYGKYPEDLQNLQNVFADNGFFTFATDNLYLLSQYAKEVQPDIIIINLPTTLILSDEDLKHIETNICQRRKCPQIFINYKLPKDHNPKIHQWNFKGENLTYEQILKIVKFSKSKHTFH
ncbi:MAG: hypothetical protein IJW75_02695 [Alphaproteobacteria bacterium]|nr:hypothetical protein [Alphaproteobacteria bacterium]